MSWLDIIPRTTPDEARERWAKAMHITECAGNGADCTGWLGPYETYTCICWCHHNPKENLSE